MLSNPLAMSMLSTALTSVIGVLVAAIWACLVKFVKSQRQVNEANATANRAVQKMQIYALYEKVVERGEPITPEEFSAGCDCYKAYSDNGGNGTGHMMWERIEESAEIVTHGHLQ